MPHVQQQYGVLREGGQTAIISGDGQRKKIHSEFTDGTEMIEEYDNITDELLLRKVRKAQPNGQPQGPVISTPFVKGDADDSGVPWVIEYGEESVAEQRHHLSSHQSADNSRPLLQDLFLKNTQPLPPVRKDTPDAFVFRIRNLTYPPATYTVTIGESAVSEGSSSAPPKAPSIVVRTSNKKYFKRIEIPDLLRAGYTNDNINDSEPLEQINTSSSSPSATNNRALSWEHKNNTLIITFQKPQGFKVLEHQLKKERQRIPVTRLPSAGVNGDIDAISRQGCQQQ